MSEDGDFSYASEAGEALERLDGGATKTAVSVPAPDLPESAAEIRRSSGRSLLISVAVGLAAVAALWLFGGF